MLIGGFRRWEFCSNLWFVNDVGAGWGWVWGCTILADLEVLIAFWWIMEDVFLLGLNVVEDVWLFIRVMEGQIYLSEIRAG